MINLRYVETQCGAGLGERRPLTCLPGGVARRKSLRRQTPATRGHGCAPRTPNYLSFDALLWRIVIPTDLCRR